MKPFYSIQELAELLDESAFNVANGLIASGVVLIYKGQKADLSKWEPPAPPARSGDQIFVGVERYWHDPRPSDVVVATDNLPESWKKCIDNDNFTATNNFEETTAEAPTDWKDIARKIADSLDEADAKARAHDSVKSIADRVANEMRTMGQVGPRGPLSGATVLREALQGGKWKRKNTTG